MKRDLHFEIVYPHPPERVWQALTDSAAIADWLMPNDFEPRVGHKFTFRTHPAPGFNGIIDSEVLEMDPPKRLVYTWCNGKLNTCVTWTLHPTQGGTQLILDHTGFEGLRGWMLSNLLGQGWRSKKLAQKLPAYLERGASERAAKPGTPSTP
jgi:uncharacterized protein YndB with AHSA1/START domain